MRQLRLICVAFATTAALVCCAASVALAEEGGNPFFLPLTFHIKFTTPLEKKVTIFETKTLEEKTFKMECKERAASTGEITSQRLGVVKFVFTGCAEASGGIAKCQTGATLGEVVVNAEFHLVALKVNAELTAGILILFPETTVTCGGFKDVYKGKLIGRIPVTQVNKKVKSFEVLYEETNGTQAIRECQLTKELCEAGGVPIKFKFEANLNEVGVFKETGLRMLEYTITPEVEVEIKT